MDCSLVMAPSQHGPYLGILVASVSSVYLDWPRDTCHIIEMMILRGRVIFLVTCFWSSSRVGR